MSQNNLPPGCSSPDGGIDHGYETAVEKALDMAAVAGLTATELIVAMEIGIAALGKIKPIIDECTSDLKAENQSLGAYLHAIGVDR